MQADIRTSLPLSAEPSQATRNDDRPTGPVELDLETLTHVGGGLPVSSW